MVELEQYCCGSSRDEADEWLARFPQRARVMPYDGRFGWNSLRIDLPREDLIEAVLGSYHYAVAALPRAQRPAGPNLV